MPSHRSSAQPVDILSYRPSNSGIGVKVKIEGTIKFRNSVNWEGLQMDEGNPELETLVTKCIKKGRQEHKDKNKKK